MKTLSSFWKTSLFSWRTSAGGRTWFPIFCMICLGISLGFYYKVYFFERVIACLFLVQCFPSLSKTTLKNIPYGAWLAVAFCLYVIITPGHWFVDYKPGMKMLFPFFIGILIPFIRRDLLFYTAVTASAGMIGCLLAAVFSGHYGQLLVGDRLQLVHDGPNFLGPMCAWCMLYILYAEDMKRIPLFRWILFLGLLVILVLSASRTSLIAFFIAALALGLRRCFAVKHIVAGSVFLALCAGILYHTLPDSQQERMTSIATIWEDPTILTRRPIWHIAIQGIREAPLMGNGLKHFEEFHTRYVKEHFEELKEEYPLIERSTSHPHNIGLFLMYSYGIAGTLLFLAALCHGGLLAWKQNDNFFLAVIVFTAMHGLTDMYFLANFGGLLLFLPLGIIFGRAIYSKSTCSRLTET